MRNRIVIMDWTCKKVCWMLCLWSVLSFVDCDKIRRGKQLGIDFSNAYDDPDTGLKCVNDAQANVQTKEREKLLECTHSNINICHYTYVTKFNSQREEKCQDNYEKVCSITFKRAASNETIQKCYRPMVQRCDQDNSNRVLDPNADNVICKTVFESECSTRYIEKQPGKFVGDTKCTKLPKQLCGFDNCQFVAGEEECHNKTIAVATDVPEEACDLVPQKTCRGAFRLVPYLSPEPLCEDVPREVCSFGVTGTTIGEKPLITKWCYDPNEGQPLTPGGPLPPRPRGPSTRPQGQRQRRPGGQRQQTGIRNQNTKPRPAQDSSIIFPDQGLDQSQGQRQGRPGGQRQQTGIRNQNTRPRPAQDSSIIFPGQGLGQSQGQGQSFGVTPVPLLPSSDVLIGTIGPDDAPEIVGNVIYDENVTPPYSADYDFDSFFDPSGATTPATTPRNSLRGTASSSVQNGKNGFVQIRGGKVITVGRDGKSTRVGGRTSQGQNGVDFQPATLSSPAEGNKDNENFFIYDENDFYDVNEDYNLEAFDPFGLLREEQKSETGNEVDNINAGGAKTTPFPVTFIQLLSTSDVSGTHGPTSNTFGHTTPTQSSPTTTGNRGGTISRGNEGIKSIQSSKSSSQTITRPGSTRTSSGSGAGQTRNKPGNPTTPNNKSGSTRTSNNKSGSTRTSANRLGTSRTSSTKSGSTRTSTDNSEPTRTSANRLGTSRTSSTKSGSTRTSTDNSEPTRTSANMLGTSRTSTTKSGSTRASTSNASEQNINRPASIRTPSVNNLKQTKLGQGAKQISPEDQSRTSAGRNRPGPSETPSRGQSVEQKRNNFGSIRTSTGRASSGEIRNKPGSSSVSRTGGISNRNPVRNGSQNPGSNSVSSQTGSRRPSQSARLPKNQNINTNFQNSNEQINVLKGQFVKVKGTNDIGTDSDYVDFEFPFSSEPIANNGGPQGLSQTSGSGNELSNTNGNQGVITFGSSVGFFQPKTTTGNDKSAVKQQSDVQTDSRNKNKVNTATSVSQSGIQNSNSRGSDRQGKVVGQQGKSSGSNSRGTGISRKKNKESGGRINSHSGNVSQNSVRESIRQSEKQSTRLQNKENVENGRFSSNGGSTNIRGGKSNSLNSVNENDQGDSGEDLSLVFHANVPEDLEPILDIVDDKKKTSLKVGRVVSGKAPKGAEKSALAKVIKHKDNDSDIGKTVIIKNTPEAFKVFGIKNVPKEFFLNTGQIQQSDTKAKGKDREGPEDDFKPSPQKSSNGFIPSRPFNLDPNENSIHSNQGNDVTLNSSNNGRNRGSKSFDSNVGINQKQPAGDLFSNVQPPAVSLGPFQIEETFPEENVRGSQGNRGGNPFLFTVSPKSKGSANNGLRESQFGSLSTGQVLTGSVENNVVGSGENGHSTSPTNSNVGNKNDRSVFFNINDQVGSVSKDNSGQVGSIGNSQSAFSTTSVQGSPAGTRQSTLSNNNGQLGSITNGNSGQVGSVGNSQSTFSTTSVQGSSFGNKQSTFSNNDGQVGSITNGNSGQVGSVGNSQSTLSTSSVQGSSFGNKQSTFSNNNGQVVSVTNGQSIFLSNSGQVGSVGNSQSTFSSNSVQGGIVGNSQSILPSANGQVGSVGNSQSVFSGNSSPSGSSGNIQSSTQFGSLTNRQQPQQNSAPSVSGGGADPSTVNPSPHLFNPTTQPKIILPDPSVIVGNAQQARQPKTKTFIRNPAITNAQNFAVPNNPPGPSKFEQTTQQLSNALQNTIRTHQSIIKSSQNQQTSSGNSFQQSSSFNTGGNDQQYSQSINEILSSNDFNSIRTSRNPDSAYTVSDFTPQGKFSPPVTLQYGFRPMTTPTVAKPTPPSLSTQGRFSAPSSLYYGFSPLASTPTMRPVTPLAASPSQQISYSQKIRIPSEPQQVQQQPQFGPELPSSSNYQVQQQQFGPELPPPNYPNQQFGPHLPDEATPRRKKRRSMMEVISDMLEPITKPLRSIMTNG